MKKKKKKQKNKKEEGSQHVTKKEKIKRKEEANMLGTLEVNSNMKGIFEGSFHEFLPSSFLSILRIKFYGGLGQKKTWILPFIFLPLHSTKHTPKKFISLFSL